MLPEGNSICQHKQNTPQEERGKERTGIELDEVSDLARLQVNADRVIDLDEGVWVADGAGVVGDQVGDTFGADDDLLHLAQLVLQTNEDKSSSIHFNTVKFPDWTSFLGGTFSVETA